MSLLGFDAMGRLAVGQLPVSQPAVLIALPAAYAAGGRPVIASVLEAVGGASFGVGAGAMGFANAFSAPKGGFAVVGSSVSFAVPLSVITASYATSYKGAVSAVRYAVASASYTLAPRTALFAVSTGTAAGGVVIVGYDAEFGRGYEAWFALPIVADQWTNELPSEENGWRPAAVPTDGRAVEPVPDESSTSRSGAAGRWTKS
jgi:hypothetical protein